MKVFYDLDGTLLNSKREIVYTIQKALEENGFSLADAVAPIRIGPPLRQILLNSYPEGFFRPEDLDKINASLRRIYDSSDYHMTNPYPGVESYVLTNKPHSATDRIIEMKGWIPFFKGIYVPDSAKGENKELVLKSFKERFPAEKIVMVGDTLNDTGSAYGAGVFGIGVLWGEGTKEEISLMGKIPVAKDISELESILFEIERS